MIKKMVITLFLMLNFSQSAYGAGEMPKSVQESIMKRLQMLQDKYKTPEQALYMRIGSDQPNAIQDIKLLLSVPGIDIHKKLSVKDKDGKVLSEDALEHATRLGKNDIISLLKTKKDDEEEKQFKATGIHPSWTRCDNTILGPNGEPI